jgi:hypothetical protein
MPGMSGFSASQAAKRHESGCPMAGTTIFWEQALSTYAF